MSLDWLTSSNPVAIWWSVLTAVSAVNIGLWLFLHSHVRRISFGWRTGLRGIEPLVLLSAAYVFGCAFRSVLPRADVERICLFDTFLSSVFVGRSVATVAEVCFALQWAIVLHELARIANSDTARNISRIIVPLIVLAECCSWYAVITTNYLGNVLENSLWTLTFAFVGVALWRLSYSFRGLAQYALAAAATGSAAYVAFMCTVDVPMYFIRWQADMADGREFFGLFSGLHDLATRWVVTHDIARWKDEIAWMSLYFSMAVWASLLLAGFSLVRHLLPHYRTSKPVVGAGRRPVPVAIRSSRLMG